MGKKALKGLTIKIGGDTSELNKALDRVEKQGRSLSSELGQINKLLKLDPKNTELLAQKQKVLAEAISNTESKLNTLKETEKQVQKQFERGEVSEAQYRALQREIIDTEGKLNKYKNAAKETADAVGTLGKKSGEAAGKLDDQAEKTQKADKASEDLDDSANNLAAGGLAALVATATAAAVAVAAVTEESREYRKEMGKLQTAFSDNDHSAMAATKTYEDLQKIVGETDQAVEAANHLAALCNTEEELADWTEILTGVYGRWGASLQIENLAETANETARVGQVTGGLADALNWAAAEGETFGVTLRKNTKKNKEWNKAVKEAKTAEDFFNLALQECSSEQERQQLITKTLTGLYGSAAKQYKKTNAEVIHANEATEKWNKATAKIGKTVDPVVTDIKEFGVTLLEDAADPLEDTAEYIHKDVLPAIKSISSWTKKHLPAIKSGLTGVAAAMVAYQAATVAATVAQKGLKGAIMATTVAQKALNLVQKASPWGLIAAGATLAVAAVAAYVTAADIAVKKSNALTAEERALVEASREAAEAFRDQKKSTEENAAGINAQMDHVQHLASELQSLADASGNVKKKDQERANFILNELKEATGEEYEMVDGQIQKYDDLVSKIDEVIRTKRANALLEAADAGYTTALQNKSSAWEAALNAERDYQGQLGITKQKESEYNEQRAREEKNQLERIEANDSAGAAIYAARILRLDAEMGKVWEITNEKKEAWDQATNDYNGYVNTIETYEAAQSAALSGNYETAVQLLSSKGEAYATFAGTVDTETAKVLDTLYQEAVNAGLKAELTRQNFENGVEGYTEEMVKEAEQGYADALGEFENAYSDAHDVGTDLSDGMTAGAESKRPSLIEKARSLVRSFLNAARDEADTHSPSKKTIEIFEDIGEGGVVGTENKTKDLKEAATKQMAAFMGTYREQEVSAQRSIRNIAEQQAARQTAGQMVAATANSGQLEQILQTLKEGQVLLLDGDVLVGGTVNRMDRKLGQLRVLSARGAK